MMYRGVAVGVGLCAAFLAVAGCSSAGPATQVTVTVTETVTTTASPSVTPSPPIPAPTPTPTPAVATKAAAPRTTAPTPAEVLAAAKASGVNLVVEDGWDKEWDLPSRQADWHPVGVMLHHTGAADPGNAPSRDFLLTYESPLPLTRYDGLTGGRRGCHFLIGRDGTVYFMRATRGPHAGTGGPMTIGDVNVPADDANGYFYGIEIESAGSSPDVHANNGNPDGFTTEQVAATSALSASLLHMLGRSPQYLTDHKAWAAEAQGKPDLVADAVETFRRQVVKDFG